jgi:histidinol-phosphate aminotransferase
MYPVFSSGRGLKPIKVNLIEGKDWWISDYEKLLDYARFADLIIIDDPNNPTGSPIFGGKLDLIKNLAERTNGLIVIDEAYYEFARYTAVPLINEYPNVIIIRTLSKAFSLASYRLGYIVGNEEIIRILHKIITPFEIPLPSLIAGITAMENSEYVIEVVNQISKNREILKNKLKNLGFKVYNSLTNFLLIKTDLDLFNILLKYKIIIRRPMEGFYRITVGTEEEINKVISILGEEIENSNTK